MNDGNDGNDSNDVNHCERNRTIVVSIRALEYHQSHEENPFDRNGRYNRLRTD